MSGLVESSIYRSVLALVEKDEEQIRQVMENEVRVNRMQIEIDDLATGLLALQQPMATDLRFITSAIKINSDLERMGDHAVNIAERARSLMHEPTIKPLIDMPQMAKLVQSMLCEILDAFIKRDAHLARNVLKSYDAGDQMRDMVYDELVQYMEA